MSPLPRTPLPIGRGFSRRAFLGLTAAGAAAVAGCSSLTPGSSSAGSAASAGPVTTAVPGDPVTLTVADADDTTMTQGLLDAFRAKYPNVTFKRQYTGWDDYLKSISLTMSAAAPPDIAQFTPGM